MTLQQVVADSNAKKPDLHFALHSNAGGGSGAECWISAKGGQAEQFAKRLMRRDVRPDAGQRPGRQGIHQPV